LTTRAYRPTNLAFLGYSFCSNGKHRFDAFADHQLSFWGYGAEPDRTPATSTDSAPYVAPIRFYLGGAEATKAKLNMPYSAKQIAAHRHSNRSVQERPYP
jgi:hypothetical protein